MAQSTVHTIPKLSTGVKLVNEHISNALDVDDFPCFLHAQLVMLLTEWNQASMSIGSNSSNSRRQHDRMGDMNALMQMATSMLPYACSPTSVNQSDVKRESVECVMVRSFESPAFLESWTECECCESKVPPNGVPVFIRPSDIVFERLPHCD